VISIGFDQSVAFQIPSEGQAMTSTSFHSQHGCHECFRGAHIAEPVVSTIDRAEQELPIVSNVHTVEARRMKTFEGQRKFQAPVADDFSRAMLAIEHIASDDGRPPKHTGLISSLTAWWRR
jgi:hypothetical protein